MEEFFFALITVNKPRSFKILLAAKHAELRHMSILLHNVDSLTENQKHALIILSRQASFQIIWNWQMQSNETIKVILSIKKIVGLSAICFKSRK